ncbi:SphA family protein [Rhodopseudomonas palustris]|uniref:Protein involved in meta-pathway of phenol degradation-like n=1 Tax=Rhodopseudomonas palustris (strain BisB18) TaxID=316056 RepID=Q21BN1_RHOPB
MTYSRRISAIATALGLALAASAAANAAESITPLQPGATTGVPNAALPPPGLYFSSDVDYAWGTMRNNSGAVSHVPADNNPNIKAANVEAVAALMWSTPWEVFGANYGMAIAQPIKFAHNTITDPLAASDWHAAGLVGTVVTPIILSWNMKNGFFIGAGFSIATTDGKVSDVWDAQRGKYVLSKSNIADNYWTFQPNFAISYIKDGWTLSANNVFDFNTKNTTTDYQTGKTYYLDVTVAKRFGKWNIGAVANYTQQYENDSQFGVSLANTKVQHVMVGPMVAYDFDRFTVMARYLANVHTENDVGISFLHLGIAMKL